MRLIVQFENLKEHFLKTFKSRVKNSPRYKQISDILRSKDILSYLAFTIYFATNFQSFLTKFQSTKPMIYISVWRKKKLSQQPEPLKMTDIGTKARDLFAPSTFKMSDNDKKIDKTCCRVFKKLVSNCKLNFLLTLFWKVLLSSIQWREIILVLLKEFPTLL